MKVRNSLRSLKKRDKDCRVIRRKGRVYVINKKNPAVQSPPGLSSRPYCGASFARHQAHTDALPI